MLSYTILITALSTFIAVTSVFLRNALLVATQPKWNRKLVLDNDSFRVDYPRPALQNHAHAYEQNGLLTVNPTAQHPIIKLIERAEAAWEAKLHRASKTLEEAVAEYRRRYKRYPPAGFDKWWKYVQDNNVLLPDEYDQIHRDLEPFWALDPVDLQKLVADEQAVVETFTIGKDKLGDHIAVVNHSFADPDHWREKNALRGAQDIIDLLKEVEDHLPPFRAVVSPMDNPMLLTDYASRRTLLQAARKNQTVSLSELPKPSPKNLRLACPPDSPAYQYGIDYNKPLPPPSQNTSFIWNHGFAMDPCSHPSLFYQHGEYLGLDERHIPPQGIKPRFSPCATLVHDDIQLPTLLGWEEVAPSDDPEWEDKLDERISWRGRNTGIWFADDGRWKSTQRTRLVQLAGDFNGTVRVLVPKPDGFAVGPGRLVEKARLNPALFDIAFADQPIDCDDDICEELERMFEWRRPQSFTEAGKHKYIFDMDGNAWSSRFKRIITTKSLIFKATIYPEWFFDRIQPWVHYIPIQMDLSDLHNTFLFFHGGLYGEGGHDAAAKKIAYAGSEWSRTFWRREDMTAYLFRLFLEYARLMDVDRHARTFKAT